MPNNTSLGIGIFYIYIYLITNIYNTTYSFIIAYDTLSEGMMAADGR